MFKGIATVVAIETLLLLAAVPKQASHGTPVDSSHIRAGEQVFLQRCFQCHSVMEGQSLFGPPLFHEMQRPRPKKTTAEIRSILKEGKGRMPAFENVLTDEDISNLLAYIRAH